MKASFVVTAALLLCSMAQPLVAQQRNAPVDATFVLEHTYWIKPGESGRFMALFNENKLPLLQEEMAEGRILWMRISEPRLRHGQDSWDIRLTIAWRNATVAWDDQDPSRFVQKHFPDPAKRIKLEQERESLILKRTDVPVQEHLLVHR
ncbi:MAG: hypothetical protein H0W68_02250 [Gemmatimonadaceae bacterium]|nr:hypothetical protein [Gemmatimonadaceae bacterium]